MTKTIALILGLTLCLNAATLGYAVDPGPVSDRSLAAGFLSLPIEQYDEGNIKKLESREQQALRRLEAYQFDFYRRWPRFDREMLLTLVPAAIRARFNDKDISLILDRSYKLQNLEHIGDAVIDYSKGKIVGMRVRHRRLLANVPVLHAIRSELVYLDMTIDGVTFERNGRRRPMTCVWNFKDVWTMNEMGGYNRCPAGFFRTIEDDTSKDGLMVADLVSTFILQIDGKDHVLQAKQQ